MRKEDSTSKREVQNDSRSHFRYSKSKGFGISIARSYIFPITKMKKDKRNQGNCKIIA